MVGSSANYLIWEGSRLAQTTPEGLSLEPRACVHPKPEVLSWREACGESSRHDGCVYTALTPRLMLLSDFVEWASWICVHLKSVE